METKLFDNIEGWENFLDKKMNKLFDNNKYEVLLFRRHIHTDLTNQTKLLDEYFNHYKYNIENYGNTYSDERVDVIIFKDKNPITKASNQMYVAISKFDNLYNVYSISFEDLEKDKERAKVFFSNVSEMLNEEGKTSGINYQIISDWSEYFSEWIKKYTNIVGNITDYRPPCMTITYDTASVKELQEIISKDNEED